MKTKHSATDYMRLLLADIEELHALLKRVSPDSLSEDQKEQLRELARELKCWVRLAP